MIAALYFIFFFLIYFPLSIWIIRKSYRFAKARYRRGWAGGVIAAFIMYNLVFWDWIPVVLMHKYLCETEGGFWIYKTPEQWVKEHPEVVGQDWSDSSKWKFESLNKNYQPDKSYYHEINRYSISPWIYIDAFQPKSISFIGGVSKGEHKLVDKKSGEVLIHSVNFQRGGSFYSGNYKIWLGNASCSEAAYEGVNQVEAKLIQLVKGDKK